MKWSLFFDLFLNNQTVFTAQTGVAYITYFNKMKENC